MKKFVPSLLVLSILSWALPALCGPLDRSLEGTLVLAAAKDTPSKKKPVTKSRPSSSGAKAWLNFYSGYDHALMGDVQEGLKDWEGVFEANGGTGSTSTGGSGFLAGVELGIPLDEDNAFSFQVETVLYRTQSVICNYNMGTEFGDIFLHPSFTDLSLNYDLRIAGVGGNGTHLLLGAGYYIAVMDYMASESLVFGAQYETKLTGDTLGGTLGLAQDFDLGGGVGLRLGVKGRVATIERMTSRSIRAMGSNYPAELALARDSSGDPDYALLAPQEVDDIDASPAIDYVVLDLSGFQATLNLEVAL